MQLLVTGATGRVGSRLVPRLIDRGDTVRVLAREPERAAALQQPGVAIVRGDLLRPATLPPAVSGVDAVMHLAAVFRRRDAARVRAVTTDGTAALAEAALQAGVRRFVFASTNLVYGSGWAKRMHMLHHAAVAQAIMRAVDLPAGDGRISNVADDQPIAGALLRVFGEPPPAPDTAQPLDDPWEGIVDTTRLRTELGYAPIYPSCAAAQEAGAL